MRSSEELLSRVLNTRVWSLINFWIFSRFLALLRPSNLLILARGVKSPVFHFYAPMHREQKSIYLVIYLLVVV